jgi:hypothetical protein
VLWVTGGLLLLAVAAVRARRHGADTAA